MLGKLDKLNYKKGMVGLSLAGLIFQAQAEVLVILPESGPMARAGNSIKQGIVAAQQASIAKLPFKFVNSDQKNIKDVLKTNVNKKTQMVIGPLDRNDVEILIQDNPKIPVLALNEVTAQHPNVWQFSLSKDEDATALLNVLKKDKIKQIYVMRQQGTEQNTLSFINALYKKFDGHVAIVETMPQLKSKDGLLLLGNNVWINSLNAIPKKRVYAQAISIEENQSIPLGLKFCDVPGIYQNTWKDLIELSRKQPTSMAYQRLYAFGGDAWQIAEQMILNPTVKTMKFNGRTGLLKLNDPFSQSKMTQSKTIQSNEAQLNRNLINRVERTPICFENTAKGLVAL